MSDKRPILFATDGSPSAAEAQPTALELAQLMDVSLVVVSVAHFALPVAGYAGYGYSNVVAELTSAEHERMQKLLTDVAEAAEAAGVRCTVFAADGIAADEICRIAEKRDVQLIVVGSHGWGAAKRFLSGSVSTALVHQAPCPVLVVRTRHHAHERAVAA